MPNFEPFLRLGLIDRRVIAKLLKTKYLQILGSVALVTAYGLSGVAKAQSAVFDGTVVSIGTGFKGPDGVAVDGKGNLFVADCGDNAVKEVLAVNGSIPASPTINALGSGFNCPGSLALDAFGNVFVADIGNSAVKEILASSAYTTVTTLGSGFNSPEGVAVDANGNVFVADSNNLVVKEILAVNGSIPANPTITTIASGFQGPAAVAVDTQGNVFVADPGFVGGSAYEGLYEILASGGYSTKNNVPLGGIGPEGIAVDANDNVFVVYTGSVNATTGLLDYSGPVVEDLAAVTYTSFVNWGGGFLQPLSVAVDGKGNIFVADYGNAEVKEVRNANFDFGSVDIGSTASSTKSLSFTFTAAGTLGSTAVVTQGATGLDFADAGNSTCTAKTAYPAGAMCSVNVKFTPTHSGPRYGAVELLSTSGLPIAKAYVQGAGVGPRVTFSPGTQKVIASGIVYPDALAVDGKGNVFVANFPAVTGGSVSETSASNGYSTLTPLSFVPAVTKPDQNSQDALAVDGAGDLVVGNQVGVNNLYYVSAEGNYTAGLIVPYFPNTAGVAVDGHGVVYQAPFPISSQPIQSINEYVFSFDVQSLVLDNPGATIFGAAVIEGVGSGFNDPNGVAVDGSGNVFVADTGNNAVKEVLKSNGQIEDLGAGFNAPNAIAVDGVGNVYVADTGNAAVKEIQANDGYVTTNSLGTGFQRPFAVAADQDGNVYVADVGLNNVVKLDYADVPPLTFAAQAKASSSAAQSITLTNSGQAALDITSIQASGDFAETDDCGTGVPAGSNCTVSVTFTPTAVGTRTGTLTIRDNGPGSPRTATLTGTGTTATNVNLSPAFLSFSSRVMGSTSPAQVITLTNSGTAALAITSIVASGDFAENNSCGSSVATGGSCTISVTFTPTAAGDRNGTLTLIDNASGSPQTVALSGTGTVPRVSLSPSSLTFASQLVGSTSTAQTVTLTNSGSASLSITSIAATGDFAETHTCGTSVAAAASCSIAVTFAPTASGTRTGTLTIGDNASGSPQIVSLSGTGTSPVSSAALSPTSLTFSSQDIGTTGAAQTVMLTNSGTAPLSITSIAASGDFAETHTCSTSLPAAANCSISVTFTPTVSGTRTGTLTVTDNATGSPQTVSLTGTVATVDVSASSNNLTISSPGGSTTANIQLSSQNGFSGTVNLTCSVAYTGSGSATDLPTCSINPSQEQVSSGTSVTSTLTVNTTSTSIAVRSINQWIRGSEGVLAALFLFGGMPRKRRRQLGLLAIFGVIAVGSITGCGGSGSSGGGGNNPPPNPGTTTGSYAITVKATSGSSSSSIQIPLSVQ